jgi:hypothetical protein
MELGKVLLNVSVITIIEDSHCRHLSVLVVFGTFAKDVRFLNFHSANVAVGLFGII